MAKRVLSHVSRFNFVVSFVACTSATNFHSKGDELSFFQMRLNGSRTFIAAGCVQRLLYVDWIERAHCHDSD